MGISLYLAILLIVGLILIAYGWRKERKLIKMVGLLFIVPPILFFLLFISPLNQM